jgi:hypothetical protein
MRSGERDRVRHAYQEVPASHWCRFSFGAADGRTLSHEQRQKRHCAPFQRFD